MAKCLVLGANGFLGSHLVDELVAIDHEVRAFDRFKSETRNFSPSSKIEMFSGDFLNRHDLAEALKGIDYVFHFISMTTPITAEDDPLIDIETNVKMSIELFEECVKATVKKIIFPSTGGAIYGNLSNGPLTEATLTQPVSPYAIGKLTIEHYLRYFNKKFDLHSVVYRISNPYGDRQALSSKQGVIPIFLQHIANNEPVTVLGDGSMVRDYIYVGDVAKLVVKTFEKAQKPIYNLGSGHGVSVNELVETIKGILNKPVKVEHKENLPTFIEKAVLDTSLFQGEFGVKPEIDLELGLKRTWEYILASQ